MESIQLGKMIIPEKVYSDYLRSLLKGKKQDCFEIVDKLIFSGLSIQEIYVHLIQKSLYAVGDLWQANKVSVAIEHMATGITDTLLAKIYPIVSSKKFLTSKKAIVACVGNEYHHIGAKIVSDVMELNGWDVSFLGANTPLLDLMSMIDHVKPKLIGLSVTMFYNISEFKAIIKNLRILYVDIPVIFGGQAFKLGAEKITQEFDKTTFINSLESLELYLKK